MRLSLEGAERKDSKLSLQQKREKYRKAKEGKTPSPGRAGKKKGELIILEG